MGQSSKVKGTIVHCSVFTEYTTLQVQLGQLGLLQHTHLVV